MWTPLIGVWCCILLTCVSNLSKQFRSTTEYSGHRNIKADRNIDMRQRQVNKVNRSIVMCQWRKNTTICAVVFGLTDQDRTHPSLNEIISYFVQYPTQVYFKIIHSLVISKYSSMSLTIQFQIDSSVYFVVTSQIHIGYNNFLLISEHFNSSIFITGLRKK